MTRGGQRPSRPRLDGAIRDRIRRLEIRLTPVAQFAQRSTSEAPRGEGRRGANERLWAGGLGSAPVETLTDVTPICSATELLFTQVDALARPGLERWAAKASGLRACSE